MGQSIPASPMGLIDPTDIYSSYGYSFGALQNLGHCCGSGHPANTSIAVATAYGVAGSDLDGFHSRYTYLAEYVQPIYIDGTPSCCKRRDDPRHRMVSRYSEQLRLLWQYLRGPTFTKA